MTARILGAVREFMRSYGWIVPDDPAVNDGRAVFVHYRNIRGQGHRSLRPGQRVSFRVAADERGRACAVEVDGVDVEVSGEEA